MKKLLDEEPRQCREILRGKQEQQRYLTECASKFSLLRAGSN